MKFTPTGVGQLDMTVVVRRAIPDTSYLVTFMVNACEETFAGYVATDARGNGTNTFTMYYGSGGTTFWARLKGHWGRRRLPRLGGGEPLISHRGRVASC